ncbi:hypothetical protein NLU13_9106 [Sarocladium strictum]|uniref:PSI domain-containing protein n=1 Tax=Sarocladium strictum TaxID=5046 RepID=A0AA39L3V7_SARSR|nr:hypothetical protein NLU13_9106 [Sarocladium strictum]
MADLRDNFTVVEVDWEHFLRCWTRQTCKRCLAADQCSWCPYTWSCVPNKHPIPFLAPIDQEDICPDRSERWELRTQPFGCDVSTTTSLSVIVSILATLFLMLCIFIVLVLVLRLRRFWRNKPPVKDRWTPTWPSSWRWGPKSQPAEAEHAPLLSPGINH